MTSVWLQRPDGAFERVAEQAGGGKSEDPGPDDSFDDRPAHSAEALHRADTHDRCRNDVGGGKRNAVDTRHLNDQGRAGLGGDPRPRLHLAHAMPERGDDSPAARSVIAWSSCN